MLFLVNLMLGKFMESPNRWVEPYRDEHRKLIVTGYDHAIDWSQVRADMAFTGLARTAGLLPEVIGVAGVSPLWEGVAQAWVILGTGVKKHRFFMHRNVGRYMDILAKTHSLRRIQATVPCFSHANLSWIESLGFELESKLAGFGPDGLDHFMYRKMYVK